MRASGGFAVHGGEEGEPVGRDAYPDVYFTPGYGRSAATADSGTWHCASLGGQIMLPYVSVPLASGDFDVASPYGYSGLHVDPSCDFTELERFWAALQKHWEEVGVVTAFLRFSPIDETSIEHARKLGSITLTQRGDTFVVPVSAGPDNAWNKMEGRSRTAIRKSERLGQVGTIREATMDDMAAGSAFRRLYEATMTRVGSSAKYLFADNYYESLLIGLRESLLIAEVCSSSGEVVAASLVMSHSERVHYHLAGSSWDGAATGANNMLVWNIIKWAAENDKRLVHLGGGVTQGDNLYRFKRSFGGRRAEFWTGAYVSNENKYLELIGTRAEELGISKEELRESQFFPPYRMGRETIEPESAA